MLFALSSDLSRKTKKRFLKNKFTVDNWDLLDCLPFRLYY